MIRDCMWVNTVVGEWKPALGDIWVKTVVGAKGWGRLSGDGGNLRRHGISFESIAENDVNLELKRKDFREI